MNADIQRADVSLHSGGNSLREVLRNAVSQTAPRFNIGAELGQRGTTANGALQERFVDVFVGITITPELRENWFRKRRID